MSDRIELANGWSLWKWVLVRGAGFPTSAVLELATGEAARCADRVLELERQAASDRQAALRELGDLRVRSQGDDRRRARRAARRLESGRYCEAAHEAPECRRAIETAADSAAALASARDELESAWDSGRREVRAALRRNCRDDRFRSAVLWQNRSAVTTGLDVLLGSSVDNSKSRSHERLVARYLQRYATKNDTIGFFGPIGWGELVAGDEVVANPGEPLIASRTVHFEHWAIDRLAAHFSEDPELLMALPPRRHPSLRLDGDEAIFHGRSRGELPQLARAIVERCDGETPAAGLAGELAGDPTLEAGCIDEVFATLESLVEAGLVIWSLEVPAEIGEPEDHLRAALEAAGESGRAALASLEALMSRRDAVSSARCPAELGEALRDLERSFFALTGEAPTRRAGETYAGRTLVYEDCRRNFELSIGAGAWSPIAEPLALVLASARWFCYRLAAETRAALARTFDELAADSVELSIFVERAWGVLPKADGAIVRKTLDDLTERWAAVLSPEPGARLITRSSAEIREAVEEQFPAPGPGWPSARFHSPDLLAAASSPNDWTEALFVLGELHAGTSTMTAPVFLAECPRRDAVIAALEQARPPLWEPTTPRGDGARGNNSSPSPRDLHVELGTGRSWRDRERVLAAADLVVTRRAGELVVRTRDGRREIDAIAFFDRVFATWASSRFPFLELGDHRPRVVVDNLVLCRERWRIESASLEWLAIEHGPEQWLAARRWARELGLPRWLFARCDGETKPIYLDLDSPILTDVFARHARKSAAMSVSEMLPAVDQSWLPDAAGRRYTSELRVVAVDPAPWSPPGGAR